MYLLPVRQRVRQGSDARPQGEGLGEEVAGSASYEVGERHALRLGHGGGEHERPDRVLIGILAYTRTQVAAYLLIVEVERARPLGVGKNAPAGEEQTAKVEV